MPFLYWCLVEATFVESKTITIQHAEGYLQGSVMTVLNLVERYFIIVQGCNLRGHRLNLKMDQSFQLLVVDLYQDTSKNLKYIPSPFSALSSQLLGLYSESSIRNLKWFYGNNTVHGNLGVYRLHDQTVQLRDMWQHVLWLQSYLIHASYMAWVMETKTYIDRSNKKWNRITWWSISRSFSCMRHKNII